MNDVLQFSDNESLVDDRDWFEVVVNLDTFLFLLLFLFLFYFKWSLVSSVKERSVFYEH
jgi:hypothetical protein